MEDGLVLVRVQRKDVLADGVIGLELHAVDAALPSWEPGAHLDLHAGNGEVRQYSLCGDPGDPSCWRVAILNVADGRGGSAWFHSELEVGDQLKVGAPRNNFALRAASEYLFVAGGIGITPILPMIRAAELAGIPWRLVYGGRTRTSMAFLDLLAGFGEKVEVVPQDERGVIDLAGSLGVPVPGRRVYCCGPEPLLVAIETLMVERVAETLHVERFRASADLDDPGTHFEVEVASSGRRVGVEPGQSIIDALDRAGVQVDFSCREGTCGTCETGVLGGVPEHRDSVLSADEQAVNDCMMICVSRCRRGPLILDL